MDRFVLGASDFTLDALCSFIGTNTTETLNDFDAYTTPGVYALKNLSNISHRPVQPGTSITGLLIVSGYTNARPVQLLTTEYGAWRRSESTSEGWSTWVKLMDNERVPLSVQFADITVEGNETQGLIPFDILRRVISADYVSERTSHTAVFGMFRVTRYASYGFFACQIYNPSEVNATGLPRYASLLYCNQDKIGYSIVNNYATADYVIKQWT